MSEELSETTKNRIERNRQKALTIKQSKLVAHPYAANKTAISIDKTTIKIGLTKYKDTGGGFLLEEKDEESNNREIVPEKEPPVLETDRPTCVKCEKTFAGSSLFDNFDFKCCDECKDPEEHKLITKTSALGTYLLKDCDLERRKPALKHILRKNPHHVSWGDMKLYLQLQVEARALEVWGSEENIEEERVKREEKRVLCKSKKYQKQLKELRMNVRSSLYNRRLSAGHEHDFGPETYNEDEDNYTRTCQTCPYKETFEKM